MNKIQEYWECQDCRERYNTWAGALAHYDVNKPFTNKVFNSGAHDRFVLVAVFEDRGDPQSARDR